MGKNWSLKTWSTKPWRIKRWAWVLLGLMSAIALSLAWVSPVQSSMPSVISEGSAADQRITQIEQTWKTQYSDYFGITNTQLPLTASEIRSTLDQIGYAAQSGLGLIYVFPHRRALELVLVVPGQQTVHLAINDAPERALTPVLNDFQQQMAHPFLSGRNLEPAQQLYQWMIDPLEPYLQDFNIDTLIFCVGAGLRSAPLAALHDGQRFLIESYSVSIIPAFSLTDRRYDRVGQTQVLAMGASEFEDMSELPAVPVELGAIANQLWNGNIFLNEDFTQANLRQQLDSGKFAIVHLATHAVFRSGAPSNSYIQLWDEEQIKLNELQELGWRDRPVELLVLSACQTALGDRQAELGFAGLSFQSGVKSTLASLWQVNDLGTLALMHEFYWQLAQPQVTTKAEALRRAQAAMLRGQVSIRDGQIQGTRSALPLPEPLHRGGFLEFSQPYYWAGFTLVGSPW